MAERMTQAAAVPQMAASCELELEALDAFRAEQNRDWEGRHGYRLSYTHLMAALAVQALVANPGLNARWTGEGIRLYRAVDLGVAMAGARGLVVPVVRGGECRSLAELGAEIVRLQRAVEANRLPPAELEGGTFTLTNVGMLGITHSVPLLNPPQAGILGIGARREHLVLAEGRVVSRPLLTVTLVADHRLVDGVMAAAFLAACRELAQAPDRLLQAARPRREH
jgi:pyruvate/2-oxoglutarate dehydrogenase complex dihydrolipoamide acyltransferase (E2) component